MDIHSCTISRYIYICIYIYPYCGMVINDDQFNAHHKHSHDMG